MSDSKKIDDGGPAFPLHPGVLPDWDGQNGMSLRDWFAGLALANQYTQHDCDPHKVAEWAYHIADAMIAARKAGAV